MNNVKSDDRSSLSTRSVNSLMRISMSEEDVFSFDFHRAAQLYVAEHSVCGPSPQTTPAPNIRSVLLRAKEEL